MNYSTAASAKKIFLSCITIVLITVLMTVAVWDPATTFKEARALAAYGYAPAPADSTSSKVKRSEDTVNMTINWQWIPFDPHGNDTMVYLHIQKTGGSAFLEHLVTLQLPVFQRVGSSLVRRAPLRLCKMGEFKWLRSGGFMNHKTMEMHMEWCPRDALNLTGETWLISEKTTGWMCGVHALYVDFVRCLRNVTNYNIHLAADSKHVYPSVSSSRTFHYVTLLRHPVLRYLSEYLHTTRGACWPVHQEFCNGQEIKQKKPPFCADCKRKQHYNMVSLGEYLACGISWRRNRLTLALADSELVTCWNKTQYTSEERGALLLESAKENLLKLAFFGILEFQEESGWLFERTFGVEFGIPPPRLPFNSSMTDLLLQALPEHQLLYEKVIANNRLDIELYWFAMEEFKKRMKAVGKELDRNTLHNLRTLLPQSHDHTIY